jgi:NAD(P)H-flavin reductase
MSHGLFHGPPSLATHPMTPVPARIRSMHRETVETFTLVLDPPGKNGKFSFLPGQFNMVYLFGVGEVALSISGDPADPSRLVHTIREVGTVTKALAKCEPGTSVGLRGPFGTPWPMDVAEGHDLLLVAGGVGLAPLRPALYRALAQRERYGRVVLLYGARRPDDVLFPAELEAFAKRGDVEIRVTVDRAGDAWHGHVGVVTSLFARAGFDPARTVALLCGPEVMMRFSARELARRGVPEERVYVSMERNMKCAVGVCGHCQYGPHFVCKDGPVFPHDKVAKLLALREV